jgi:propionyl-CoA carboxylase alpha chain
MVNGAVRFAKRRVVDIAGDHQAIEVAGNGSGPLHVSFIGNDGTTTQTVAVDSTWTTGEPVWRGTVGGKTVAVQVRAILNGATLSYRGIQAKVYVYTEREAAMVAVMPVKAAADMSKFLLCPMPGLVKAIHTGEGQDVKAGDALAVVEAMKMENILRAERDGTVKKVNAKPGDSLAVDAVILEFA